uniref:Protein FMC1 homolog n=1 Tax=Caenorhabditis tropicalis TaxID=1561998 RepID=A0A1I7U163_9PELO
MFLSSLLSFLRKPRRHTGSKKKEAWPEIEMLQMERTMFYDVQKKYNDLVQSLMDSPNVRLNQLSMKYHTEAFHIIYIGCTRIQEYDDMVEQRHALNQILERIHEEASHVN